MKLLCLTLPTPAENLALDEALLDACEARPDQEVLRFWVPGSYFVVAGFSNSLHREVHLPACQDLQIPVLRRCSGGGTVLQGPGCVNYSLALRLDHHPALEGIHSANQWIMQRQRDAFASLLPHEDVHVRGFTDLTVGNLKFSGNAQRRKRLALLFHGSILLDLDLHMVAKVLRSPSKQPEYRANRSHGDFLRNLRLPATDVIGALRKEWGSSEAYRPYDYDEVQQLVQTKYSQPEWTFKFP